MKKLIIPGDRLPLLVAILNALDACTTQDEFECEWGDLSAVLQSAGVNEGGVCEFLIAASRSGAVETLGHLTRQNHRTAAQGPWDITELLRRTFEGNPHVRDLAEAVADGRITNEMLGTKPLKTTTRITDTATEDAEEPTL